MIMGHRINSGLSSLQRVLHVKWGEKMISFSVNFMNMV